ncbi:acetyl-CoA hydrolase/transferase family protein [Sphingobium sp. Ant17]|uniref:acetyl-CoA hydrolase/transferase family protein n=1 Tax=Sphingobium sp. Ant17 TaxID=1461752 RepID=UPI0004AF77B3
MTQSASSLYESKRLSAAEAVALIPSGARVAMGLGVSEPPALLSALANRAAAGQIVDISLYYMLATTIAGATVLAYELRDRINPVSLFHGGVERALDAIAARNAAAPVDIIPVAFSQVPRMLTDHLGVDTLITTVSPMDDAGNFSFGTNTDYALGVSRAAARIIVEVNPRMPRVQGNCFVHISQISAVVENSAPLLAMAQAQPGAEDRAIAQIVAGLVEDGACLQMGIGALPDAVCAALEGHRHLGIHTELMTPGLAALMQSGVVDNSGKSHHRGRSVFTFAWGIGLFMTSSMIIPCWRRIP